MMAVIIALLISEQASLLRAAHGMLLTNSPENLHRINMSGECSSRSDFSVNANNLINKAPHRTLLMRRKQGLYPVYGRQSGSLTADVTPLILGSFCDFLISLFRASSPGFCRFGNACRRSLQVPLEPIEGLNGGIG